MTKPNEPYPGFVDPPSSFAPIEELKRFVLEMESQNDPRLQAFIDEAKDEIASRKSLPTDHPLYQ